MADEQPKLYSPEQVRAVLAAEIVRVATEVTPKLGGPHQAESLRHLAEAAAWISHPSNSH